MENSFLYIPTNVLRDGEPEELPCLRNIYTTPRDCTILVAVSLRQKKAHKSRKLLGWPKSSFGVFHKLSWENSKFLAKPTHHELLSIVLQVKCAQNPPSS